MATSSKGRKVKLHKIPVDSKRVLRIIEDEDAVWTFPNVVLKRGKKFVEAFIRGRIYRFDHKGDVYVQRPHEQDSSKWFYTRVQSGPLPWLDRESVIESLATSVHTCGDSKTYTFA